jgi:DNA-binding response OmpR family regulator
MHLGSLMRRVKADPNQLEQVLMNLVINARDAMPTGGLLRVSTDMICLRRNDQQLQVGMEPGLYVRISVTDTGTGMDAGIQSRIFEPFFTTKPVGQGTGLGLSTVYGIVKQSEGFVSVTSVLGKGSTFHVYLPPCEGEREIQVEEADAGTLSGTETILLTEDEDEVRQYTAGVLRDLGYKVFDAPNAEKAISICAELKGEVALLITDIVMPKVNGPELAAILAPLSKGMEVLYVSGYSRNAIAARGIVGEGLNLLEKPFTPEQLAKRVKQILEKRRQPTWNRAQCHQPAVRSRSILVVDDEPQILQLLSDVLSRAGYQVSTASNGHDALAICKERAFDLVITDLVMPTREGLETIQQLRSGSASAMPIIAMSGAFDGRYLRLAKNLGANRVLEKPIEPEVLLENVQGLLG